MAKAYIGADNAAKLVKAMYIGVDGVARKVTKAYRGVDGVAKLVYSEAPEGYLYGGTSTFVFSKGDLVSSKTDYTLTTDQYVLQVEKYDETPLYVYFDNELVATSTTSGEQTISVDGWTTTLASRGTIAITVVSESTYGLGEQDFYQFWDYTGSDSKNNSDKTLYGFMTSATLSDNVIKIWNYAFDRLTDENNLSIPSKGLITIGSYAFGGTIVDLTGAPHLTMTSFTVPETVTSIAISAFMSSVKNITVDAKNQHYSSVDGVLFNKDCTELIYYPRGSELVDYVIPDGVMSIGDSAFSNSLHMTSVVIPDSVTSIGIGAFAVCIYLTNITFKHGTSSPLSIYIDISDTTASAFYVTSSNGLATNVYHNGCPSVLNYDWASCKRTVTFIQL